MADPGIYAFSIRKTRQWRGQTQGFSNLYHYSIAAPTEQGLIEVLDALKAAEQPIHDSETTFVEGRSWGPVNPDGKGGRMEAVRQFSGTGGQTVTPNMYRECAYLIKWPLGRYGSKNRPQFLRKWIHSAVSTLGTNNGMDGNSDLGAASTALTTYMGKVRSMVPVVGQTPLDLKSASGHVPTASGSLYKWLEHHQYGR